MPFTLKENIGFPSFKNGFTYLNYSDISFVSNPLYSDFFDNVESVKKKTVSTITYYGIQSCKFGFTGIIVYSD